MSTALSAVQVDGSQWSTVVSVRGGQLVTLVYRGKINDLTLSQGRISDALYQVVISEERQQISWYCTSCQRWAKAIMRQLFIMHETQDQFDNKLSVLENKQETLNNRVSEVKDAVAKVADLPEETSTIRAENATHDRELMKQLTEHTTDGQYQPDSLQVRRLGSKPKNETGTDEARSRPQLVTFPHEDKKASIMDNLHIQKNKGEPFSEMVIKHDMSREDREK